MAKSALMNKERVPDTPAKPNKSTGKLPRKIDRHGRSERRFAQMHARTLQLVGRKVLYGELTPDANGTERLVHHLGKVVEVLYPKDLEGNVEPRYPKDAKRNSGAYLKIEGAERLHHRTRVKVVS